MGFNRIKSTFLNLFYFTIYTFKIVPDKLFEEWIVLASDHNP